MDFAGKAFKSEPVELGDVAAVESNGYLWCMLTVGGLEVIKFPLAIGTLQSEVELHMANVINQTGLVNGSTTVTVSEVI